MAGFSYDSSNLEGCQRVVGSQAGQFGGISDTLSLSPVSSDFGSLPESAQLAKVAAEVNDTMRSQLASAQKFLQGTEVALDQVLENYLGADQYAVFMASETTHLPAYQLQTALGE
jgi:hypothetical protein